MMMYLNTMKIPFHRITKRTFVTNTNQMNNYTHTTMKSQTMIAPEELISLLPPMKRILFICPVLHATYHDNRDSSSTSSKCIINNDKYNDNISGDDNDDNDDNNNNEYEKCSISIAVSDPYLAYAIPIPTKSDNYLTYKSLNVPKQNWQNRLTTGNNIINEGRENDGKIFWSSSSTSPSNIPQTQSDLLSQIIRGQEDEECYTDIGAILVFGLPIQCERNKLSPNKNHKIRYIRDSLSTMIGNIQTDDELMTKTSTVEIPLTTSSLKAFDLQCYVDDQPNLDEAITMSNEEPEMWEEIDFDSITNNTHDVTKLINDDPTIVTIHAAASLNAFLWKHTGGWRNTFG